MVTADFTSDEGEQQGAVESMPLFTLGVDDANNATYDKLRTHGGALIAGADDTYLIGPPEIVFPCIQKHRERVAVSGLKLNVNKTKCHIHKDYRNNEYHRLRGDIEEGHVVNINGSKSYGVKVYGIPVGSNKYIEHVLGEQAKRIEHSILTTIRKMDPLQVTAPELPGRQCCWTLTLRCIQHLGNYWARHLPPDITADFCSRVDVAVQSMVLTSTQLDTTVLKDFTRERMRLSIKCKSMGLRSLYDRRHSEYVGGMMQGIPLSSIDNLNLVSSTQGDLILPRWSCI